MCCGEQMLRMELRRVVFVQNSMLACMHNCSSDDSPFPLRSLSSPVRCYAAYTVQMKNFFFWIAGSNGSSRYRNISSKKRNVSKDFWNVGVVLRFVGRPASVAILILRSSPLVIPFFRYFPSYRAFVSVHFAHPVCQHRFSS